MIETKSCLNILIGILFCTSRVNGIFEINLPASGNYNEATEMNCTDSSFNIANGYIWYKDDLVIYDNINGDATNTGKYTSTHGVGFFTLVITNTTLDDNGMYKCSYNFQDKNDTLEIQAKGTGDGKLDGILKITLTKFYPNSTEVLSVVGSGMTFPGTQTITAAGDLFTIVWTSDADVDSSYVKNGCDVTIQSVTTYVIHADVKGPTTTTTTSSTTSTPTASTEILLKNGVKPKTNKQTNTAPTVTTSTTTSTITSNKTKVIIGITVGVFGALLVLGICIIVIRWQRRKTNIMKKGNHENDVKVGNSETL